VELGAWIASAEERPLRLAGVEADRAAGRRDASRLLARAALLVQQVTGISTEPVLLAPGPEELAAGASPRTKATLASPGRSGCADAAIHGRCCVPSWRRGAFRPWGRE
jgi:hypothetical protein